MSKFIIKDWAGNILNFKNKFERPEFTIPMEFKHFDLASDWLADTYGHLDDDAFEIQMEDLFIDEIEGDSNE